VSKILIGVSQCLLGDQVRYDGSHKHNRFLTDVLSQYVDYRPVCPEVAIGMGIPRKPIRLIARDGQTRVQGVIDQGADFTEALSQQAELSSAALQGICGYVFMQNSPSCGVYRVKRYGVNGMPLDSQGRGAYAQRFIALNPLLPVEEAGRLNDLSLRDNFIARVFAYRDFQEQLGSEPSAKKLIDFYSRYKYQVMAHHVPSYYAIGRFLANLAGKDSHSAAAEFFRLFMTALTYPAGRKGNTNAMMHLRGYLKAVLQPHEKQEVSQLIQSYRDGYVPLIVPLTLLRHHLRKLDNPYLKSQTFWAPHPENLGLRNHISEVL